MKLEYEHLLGREFNIETQNCYHILRDFYLDNYGIELLDVPCPTNWWATGLNLYAAMAEAQGFSIINENPRHWRPGDVILMAIQSSNGNHVGIVLDNGKVLHHLLGQRSCVTPYGGMLRNNTVGVYRHKNVALFEPENEVIDFRTLLTPYAKRKLEELEAQRAAQSEADLGT